MERRKTSPAKSSSLVARRIARRQLTPGDGDEAVLRGVLRVEQLDPRLAARSPAGMIWRSKVALWLPDEVPLQDVAACRRGEQPLELGQRQHIWRRLMLLRRTRRIAVEAFVVGQERAQSPGRTAAMSLTP